MESGTPSDSNLRGPGRNSEARSSAGRISIHSLLAPEGEASSSDQTPSYSLPASSSQSPTSTPSTSTPLSSNISHATAPPTFTSTSTSSTTPSSSIAPNVFQSQLPSLAATEMQNRTPRAPRPSYSEEQKFFIMYARIMRDQTWPEIEDQFNVIFGTRTKGGLTSVYYRVRKDWGLMEVLKSGPDSFTADCKEVERRARNFSAEFLAQIGYLLPER